MLETSALCSLRGKVETLGTKPQIDKERHDRAHSKHDILVQHVVNCLRSREDIHRLSETHKASQASFSGIRDKPIRVVEAR